MKGKVFIMLALVAALFTSCSDDDSNNTPDNLAGKVIGKWMMTQFNGRYVTTNEMMVYTILSPTSGYVTTSGVDFSENQMKWTNRVPCDVAINGNTVSLRGNFDKNISFEGELVVNSIIPIEMLAESKYNVYSDGRLVSGDNGGTILWTNVVKDHSEGIRGTWEGVDNGLYGDGQLHRWQFNDNGTYIYYRQNANGEWVADVNSTGEYIVDGILLCTRWADNNGVEKRERWEIASINHGFMTWYAIRQHADGTIYTTTLNMIKIQ